MVGGSTEGSVLGDGSVDDYGNDDKSAIGDLPGGVSMTRFSLKETISKEGDDVTDDGDGAVNDGDDLAEDGDSVSNADDDPSRAYKEKEEGQEKREAPGDIDFSFLVSGFDELFLGGMRPPPFSLPSVSINDGYVQVS